MMRKWYFIFLIAAALLGLKTASSFAQTPEPAKPSDDEVNTIAKQLYCPVCENIPLDVCGTQACEQWRGLIRQRLSEGWNEAQIKSYFVQQYGDRVLATPPARGINWLIYVIPPLIILGGALFLYQNYLSQKVQQPKTSKDTSQTESPDQDEYIKLIEEELSNR